MASLGALVAGVAHEINTPLGVSVTGVSHLGNRVRDLKTSLSARGLSRREFEAFLSNATTIIELLQSNLGRVTQLVDSFKEVAVDQGNDVRRPFDLAPLVQDFMRGLQPKVERAGHKLLVDIPPKLEMHSHPGALARVLSILILNSLDHAYDGPGGTLSLRAELEATGEAGETGETEGVIEEDDLFVRLVFEDDGKGIDPDHLGKLFDPFFTTRRHAGNSGLGLHLAHNLVLQALGGTIEAESTRGAWTRFILRLPVWAPE